MDGRYGEGFREMVVKRWRQKTVDSEEWASIIKEAKAVRGPLLKGTFGYCRYRENMLIPYTSRS
jgi:hypothetical protein